MASQPIYQFYAELRYYKPKIWRRFQDPANITMARLGYILMTMYEMQASHLFCLTVPVRANFEMDLRTRHSAHLDEMLSILPRLDEFRRFEVSNEELFTDEQDENTVDAAEAKIKNVISTPKDRLVFEYDFSDSWEVDVTLEEILIDTELPGKELPRVLDGAGYGIIEDCGGTSGLEDLARAYRKKSGRAYQEFREWLGRDELDLSAFDRKDMDFRLKKVPRIYTDIYEHGLAPTAQSIKLLERAYLKQKGDETCTAE